MFTIIVCLLLLAGVVALSLANPRTIPAYLGFAIPAVPIVVIWAFWFVDAAILAIGVGVLIACILHETFPLDDLFRSRAEGDWPTEQEVLETLHQSIDGQSVEDLDRIAKRGDAAIARLERKRRKLERKLKK